MDKKVCRIVCAGENFGYDFDFGPGDLVIAVDGGLDYLLKAGIKADIFIGDCDSLRYEPDNKNCAEIIKLKTKKDMTDTFAAANEGLKRGCSFFYIYCGTGGEIDHTLANIQTLIYLSGKNKRVFLFDGVKVITAVSGGGKICFSDKARGRISVLCAGSESLGVDIRGLLYEASSLDLKNSFPLGARNEFTGKESSVFVKQGCLLIVFDSDAIKHMI